MFPCSKGIRFLTSEFLKKKKYWVSTCKPSATCKPNHDTQWNGGCQKFVQGQELHHCDAPLQLTRQATSCTWTVLRYEPTITCAAHGNVLSHSQMGRHTYTSECVGILPQFDNLRHFHVHTVVWVMSVQSVLSYLCTGTALLMLVLCSVSRRQSSSKTTKFGLPQSSQRALQIYREM